MQVGVTPGACPRPRRSSAAARLSPSAATPPWKQWERAAAPTRHGSRPGAGPATGVLLAHRSHLRRAWRCPRTWGRRVWTRSAPPAGAGVRGPVLTTRPAVDVPVRRGTRYDRVGPCFHVIQHGTGSWIPPAHPTTRRPVAGRSRRNRHAGNARLLPGENALIGVTGHRVRSPPTCSPATCPCPPLQMNRRGRPHATSAGTRSLKLTTARTTPRSRG